jgi:ArsR family transcriptional regulator
MDLRHPQFDISFTISYNYDIVTQHTNTHSRGPDTRLASNAERLARMLRALGNPVRFRIMQTLAERRTCITGEIVATTPLAQSTVSQHLKVLREAGLIRGEVEGPATCYCIDPAGVRWLKEQIEGWLPGCCEPVLQWNIPREEQREAGK